jgi:hypothetical protein
MQTLVKRRGVAVEIEVLNLLYFQFGLPCPYEIRKGGEILIHPVKVKDNMSYLHAKTIMEIKKDEMNDFKILTMSYLEFLKKEAFKTQSSIDKFIMFNQIVFGYTYIDIIEKDEDWFVVFLEKEEGELVYKYIIDEVEYMEMVKISFFQNDPLYDDSEYSKEIREAIEAFYKAKYGKSNPPTLEKQIAYVISRNGWEVEKIMNMTQRLFSQVLKSIIDSEIYMVNNIMKASEKFKIDEEIKHPLHKKDKKPVEEVFVSDSELRKKIH